MTQTQSIEPTLDLGSDDSIPIDSKYWACLVPLSNNPPEFSKEILIEKDVHNIGRSKQNDTKFDSPGISGNHAKIYRENSSNTTLVWIEDTSTNGTVVNNVCVGKNKKKLIKTGDTIVFLKKTEKSPEISYLFKNLLQNNGEKEHGGLSEKYDIGDTLGSGNFAVVKLAFHKETGEKYAVKIIDKKKFALSSSSTRKNALMDEVEILQKINHPYCISIHEMFETNDKLYLILEYVSGGELFDKIVDEGYFEEDVARRYMTQMLEAVKYLHDQGIVHRDLKPENILLKSKTDDTIKLSDFGLSRGMDSQSYLKTMCGTPQYVAPEVLSNAGPGKEGYNLACDLWSLGVIAYILLCGYPPFHEEKEGISLYDQILTADFEFPRDPWQNVSEEAKDFVEKLLVVDTSKRLTAEQALKHPFILNEKLKYTRIKRKNEVSSKKVKN